MLEMVESRRNENKGEQYYDLFSGLLDAAQDEPNSEATLNDEELIGRYSISRSFSTRKRLTLSGNMFIFILAGHEVISSRSSCGVSPNRFSTDHSANIMLLTCLIGTIS